MGIAITEDHRQLADVVRSFLLAHDARGKARILLDTDDERRPDFWVDVVNLGWLGLHVPEEFGGTGFGLPELVIVVEEFGRGVVSGPFIPTVIASGVVVRSGSTAQRERWLPKLVDGTLTAGIGFATDLTITGTTVCGDAGVVMGAGLADIVVLSMGDDVVAIDANQPGVAIDLPGSLDPTRRSGRVTLHDVAITAEQVLPAAAASALALARIIVAAEAVGGAQDCLDAALGYAKVREQFGRTIGTFQAIKHHLANMLVAAEAALATVWDAARASDTDEEFQLMAASAATLALPAYVKNAELNIQIHGGIGYTWEHDAHLHLRRAATLRALFGGSSPPADVVALSAKGITRENSLDLPPEAEQLRERIRVQIAAWADLDEKSLHQQMIDTGYMMPHWPKPWGRAADAVEQLVIEQEFSAAAIDRPDFGIAGWVVFTLIQHGTDEQIDRFVLPALRGEHVWCQLFSEPGAGSDAAAVSTTAVRADGGWIINGQKVWTSGAQHCQFGLATVRTDPKAGKHAGITTVIVDMATPGIEVRPLRQITGSEEFNEVFFSDVFVPDDDVVGGPNRGWTVARATLGNERVSIGGRAEGGQEAANVLLRLHVSAQGPVAAAIERTGRYLADEHALRLLNLRSATRSIVGGEPGPEGNVTKLLLAEHVSECAALTADLIGPDVALASGLGTEAGLMVLSARMMAIAGGTSEITRNQIAERILGLPRDPLIK